MILYILKQYASEYRSKGVKTMPSSENRTSVRERIFQIIEIGAPGDYASRAYDVVNMLSIVINLIVSIMYSQTHISHAQQFQV